MTIKSTYPDRVKELACEESALQETYKEEDEYDFDRGNCTQVRKRFNWSDSRQGYDGWREATIGEYTLLGERVKTNNRCPAFTAPEKKYDAPVTYTPEPKKYTYEKQFVRSDGVVFTKNTIGAQYIAEIERDIESKKKTIQKLESLLKAHHNLFNES